MNLFILRCILKINKEKSKSAFLGGALSLTLATLSVKVIGVIYKIPLSYILGDEGMGFFNSAYSVYTFFFLLCTAGVPKAVTILITESRSKNSIAQEASILRDTTMFFSLIGLAITIVFALSSKTISEFIGNRHAHFSMLAISPSIFFIALSSVYRGYLGGLLQFGKVAISQCLEAFFKLAAGLVLAKIAHSMNFSAEYVCAFAIFGITAGSFISFSYLYIEILIAKKRFKKGQNTEKVFNNIRKICKISVPITASAAIMSLVNVIDLTLIMRRLNDLGYTESISGMLYGNYTTLSIPMFNLVLSIVTSITTACLPILSEGYTRKPNVFYKNAGNLIDIVMFIAAPASVLFFFYPTEILALLFEKSSVALGSALLCAIAPSVLMISVLTALNTIIESAGGYNIPFLSMLAGCTVKLLSTYLLVGYDKFAIWGAPIGTALSYLVSVLISVFFVCKRRLLSISHLRNPATSLLISLAAFVLTNQMKAMFSFLEGALLTASLLLIFAIIYLALSLAFGVMSIKKLKSIAN